MRYIALLLLGILAAMAGSCDLFDNEQARIKREVLTKLNLLQIAVEQHAQAAADEPPEHTATDEAAAAEPATLFIAVVAIVDGYFMESPASEEDEEATAGKAAAQRRERVVRQELNNRFVENRLTKVVHPSQDKVEKARLEIIAANSAALTPASAKEIGEMLNVEVVICVLIDKNGNEVNVVAQTSAEGKLIYQDTIMHWELVVAAAEQSEEAE